MAMASAECDSMADVHSACGVFSVMSSELVEDFRFSMLLKLNRRRMN